MNGRRFKVRKLKPEAPKGCGHLANLPEGSAGWCEPCKQQFLRLKLAEPRKKQRQLWRQQDRSAEQAMRFGPPKPSKPMTSASFLKKVRDAGPRLD